MTSADGMAGPVDGDGVVIAVPTFRRVDQLRELLPLLAAQAQSLSPAALVIVADNDPAGSAEHVVSEWSERGVRYVHEPSPGLAAVRNRLLREAGTSGAIAFIDDDEAPTADWLTRLVDAWRRFDCAAVSGPVRSVFATDPPRWVLATGVFDRRRHKTGKLMQGGASNNLLLDLGWLRAAELHFDHGFGESGGEDTMLMHSIAARGGAIRWCDEAEVTELVPAERLTRDWVGRRLVRTSNSWARVELIIGAQAGRPLRTRFEVALRIPYFFLRGLARLGVGFVGRSPNVRATGVCDLYKAMGVGRATLGSVSAEYRRPATS